MSGFYDQMRYQAIGNLFEAGADAGRRWQDARAQKKADANYKAGYAAALLSAQQTGEMPLRYQTVVAKDDFLSHGGLKAVLLRELQKVVPDHPLVTSRDCRLKVASCTKILFNRAGRPEGAAVEEFAPDDAVVQRILAAYR